jgi:hypothetical protein
MAYGTGKKFNHMTILENGSGQHSGKIGEMCFADWLIANDVQFTWSACDKGPFDFSVMLDGRMVGIDVKAKERNVPANWEHDAHVTADQEHYACQIYVFCNVTNDDPTLMGWCGKKEFWSRCRRVKKGDSEGSFVEHTDAGKMPYKNLRKLEDLLAFT